MSDTFYRHLTQEGERWDNLAARYRPNPYDYIDIIESNDQYQQEFVLPPGVIILVPVKETVNTRLIPPWERT
jgi:hypothetical protein